MKIGKFLFSCFVNSFWGCATARRVLEVFGFDYFDYHGDVGGLGYLVYKGK